MITPQQCRAGRALLDWPQQKLAERAGVSVSTVRDFEGESRSILLKNNLILKEALERPGVVFDFVDHGVRLPAKKEGSR